MDKIKVLVFFNQKKFQFSVEALEGPLKNKVIAHTNEITLTDCRFSKDKSKTAGVIGTWHKKISNSKLIEKFLGGDKCDCECFLDEYREYGVKPEGYFPKYYGSLIKFDIKTDNYILRDTSIISLDIDNTYKEEIENDNNFKKVIAKDDAALIHLDLWEDDEETADDINGVAYYWISEDRRQRLLNL